MLVADVADQEAVAAAKVAAAVARAVAAVAPVAVAVAAVQAEAVVLVGGTQSAATEVATKSRAKAAPS